MFNTREESLLSLSPFCFPWKIFAKTKFIPIIAISNSSSEAQMQDIVLNNLVLQLSELSVNRWANLYKRNGVMRLF